MLVSLFLIKWLDKAKDLLPELPPLQINFTAISVVARATSRGLIVCLGIWERGSYIYVCAFTMSWFLVVELWSVLM